MLTVLLPWRPQPSRLAAFAVVEGWYRTHLPEAEVRTVDSDDEVFNLARCRNLGVASVADPHSVVVIGDADTIPQDAALREAIAAARDTRAVQLPYDDYRWLGAAGTAELADGTAEEECTHVVVRGACSGVYVTTPETWWAHGGQDEEFRGWGFEDAAWYLAHETLLGRPPQRHRGSVFALHHVAESREGPQYDANAALMERYREASRSAEAMRQLVTRAVAAPVIAAKASSGPLA